MSKRGVVDMATLGRAKDDEAAIVRYAALQALDRIGQPVSLDEAQQILAKARSHFGLFGLGDSHDSVGLSFFNVYSAERMRAMPPSAIEALLTSTTHRVGAYQALSARRIGAAPF